MTDLPTGTVTFMRSDIEGSTRLLQELGSDLFDRVQADHAAILRRAISGGGGVEIRTEGDAFFASFASHTGAVRAVVDAQRGLAEHPWPDGAVLRVRMGLHSGDGRLGGDDYVGADVNRLARIAAAGAGGQVLLSDATRALVEHQLPEGVILRDLGTHRLKDFDHPEHLFDLVIEGLPSEFPVLETLDTRPNNLPPQMTSFVGRDAEIDQTVGQLRERRLVTLVGPGGTGKTRLALAAGAELLPSFRDGVFFVDLAPLSQPDQVCPAICRALGLVEDPQKEMVENLASMLEGRDLLLLLDNFEHLLEAAPLVGEVLSRAEGVRALATSRAALGLYGEQEIPIPPLDIPDPDGPASPDSVSRYEAVALFVDRARQVRPGFELTDSNAEAVARICTRLDGLPLAIELAASRIKVFSPQALQERLENSLEVLAAGSTNAPLRQRTLRATIAWSYDLLGDLERGLVSRLSVFAGGADLEAIESVGDADGDLQGATVDVLSSLVDKSLVRQTETKDGEPRFGMLETIRAYAGEWLDERWDGEATRRRHAEHFLDLAIEAESHVTGPNQIAWLDRCDREHANLRAALRWAIDNDWIERAQEAAGALWRFWQQRGHLREARRLFEEILTAPSGQGRTKARAKALTGAGGIAWWQGDTAGIGTYYEEALSILQEVGDPADIAEATYNSAFVPLRDGNYPGAAAIVTESLALAREAGEERTVANALSLLALQDGIAGDPGPMVVKLEEVAAILRRLGDRFHLADNLLGLGTAYALAGRPDDGRRVSLEAIEAFVEADNITGIIAALLTLAFAAGWEGRHEDAVRLAGASDALREFAGGGPPTYFIGFMLGDPVAQARSELQKEAADAAWEEGRSMSLEDAVAFAREEASG